MKRISEILIIASTKFEVNQIIKQFSFLLKKGLNTSSYNYKNLTIDVLVSGIGIPSTTYLLTKAISKKKYDLVLNVGICGSFKKNIEVGKVVNVIEDEFADLGITDVNNNFVSLFEKGFIYENEFPFTEKRLISKFNDYEIGLQKVAGITVNATSGNNKQIKMRKELFNVDIETMEGAAVAFVCLSENINHIQIRAVSNPIEPRNKKNWDIPLAITNLSNSVINFLNTISM